MLRQNVDDPPFVAPLIAWLVVQLIALLLAAGHVRLWAGASIATESLAVNELLIVQFIASSLLFPFLCRSWQSTIAIAIASLPMIALAGVLAGEENGNCLVVAIELFLWLFGLGFWRRILTTPHTQMIAVSIVSSLNITGLVLIYLASEARGVRPVVAFAVPPFDALNDHQIAARRGLAICFAWFTLSAVIAAIFRAKLSTGFVHRAATRD